MKSSNINNFNQATLFILSYLYDKFPRKVEIDTTKILAEEIAKRLGPLWVSGSDVDPEDELSELHFISFLSSTLVWLKEEGYIRYSDYDLESGFYGVILSNKGLMLLGKPSSLSSADTLVESIKSEFKKGTANGLQKLGQQLIESGVSKYLVNGE